MIAFPICTDYYRKAALKEHNAYRKLHKSPPMKLDSGLNELAAKCAKHYLARHKIDHSCKMKGASGENLYISKGCNVRSDLSHHSVLATKLWYDEIQDYNFKKPSKSNPGKMVGHFTQLVWKKSSKLGIGHAVGYDHCVIVALYQPPGNIVVSGAADKYEKYHHNVLPAQPGDRGKTGDTDSASTPKNAAVIGGITFATIILARFISLTV